MPTVSLEMHEQTMNGVRETEDVNTHHLLQQHLYKGRKQVSIFSLIILCTFITLKGYYSSLVLHFYVVG